MLSLLLILTLTLTQGKRQTTPHPHEEYGDFSFSAMHLPRICKECCFDVMFVLDRSDSVMYTVPEVPGQKKESVGVDNFSRMKRVVADLAASELNDPKVRVGMMQMGTSRIERDMNKLASGSAKTAIKFGLQNGPFDERTLHEWGTQTVFAQPDKSDFRLAARLARDHLMSQPRPWIANQALQNVCTLENHKRLIVWIVDGAPMPEGLTPCRRERGQSKTLVQTMLDEEISNYIVGVGPEFKAESQKLECMFPGVSDFSNVIKFADNWPDLSAETHNLFAIDPCTECGNLDLVFLLDESGSLCDEHTPSNPPGICQSRTEWDKQIDFAKQIVQEISPTWSQHRVAVKTFGSTVRSHISLKQTGAASKKTYPNTNVPSGALDADKTWGPNKVLLMLEQIRNDFREGRTCTADAWSQALKELEWAPERVDQVKTKRVVLYLTDGGPNPGYYAVDEDGERYTKRNCPFGKSAMKGMCMTKEAGNPLTTPGGRGQTQAVCTDMNPNDPTNPMGGDTKPKWLRYRMMNGNLVPFVDESKTYPMAIKFLDITPIIVLTGDRMMKHVEDVDCLMQEVPNRGGLITPDSFFELVTFMVYRKAITDGLCKNVVIGGNPSSTTPVNRLSNTGIFAKWNDYTAWKESQQNIIQDIENDSSASSASNFVIGGVGLLIGAIFGGLFIKKARSTNDYSFLNTYEENI